MPVWLLWLLVCVACVLAAAIFAFILFPNLFFTNTASNMNAVRATLVKANKNKTYRIGIYVDGDLSEVFFSMLKGNLQKYKLPVVFTPLHREAARNLMFEGEWFNRIAYPDGQMVDVIILMELNENLSQPVGNKQQSFHALDINIYYPNGAYHGGFYWESRLAIQEALRDLARTGTIRSVHALCWILGNPESTPNFTANANAWPYSDSGVTAVYPQNTPR